MSTHLSQRTRWPRGLVIDLPWGKAQPGLVRTIASLIVAVVASLAACWALAILGVALMPATATYEHFQFADYARLTIIGVVIAGLAWPVVTLLSTQAWRIYLVADIIVTIVSFAPDLWIIRGGQPTGAVIVLMAMHVALGVIVWVCMVFGAPQRR